MGEKRAHRLSATVFRAILAAALIAGLAVTFATVTVYYLSHERAEEARLLSLAEATASRLDGLPEKERTTVLGAQFADLVRYTLIAQDGEVLFDSAPHVGTPESHERRPEVRLAKERGEGAVSRHSETLGVDTLYAAVRLGDGSVLRLSETRESFASFAGSFVIPMVATLALLALLGVGASRILARRILRPLERLDVSSPLSADAYAEMQPMLARLDEQQRMLKEQNAELARAEGMRRVFSANVSHEMKTPLQILSGYSEVIATGMAEGDQARAFAEKINQESQRMQALIDDVLTLSRIDDPVDAQLQSADVELFSLAREVVERLDPLARKREVRVSVLGSEVRVRASRDLLAEALSNLVSNAIRYSDAGGAVVVSVRKECHPEDVDVPPEAVVSVRDEGCGIPLDEQQRIFERFYRVDKSRSKETGGTGLGLAIAKHAAEANGGTITVESEPNVGSTFSLRLPHA